ncbi:hypothetical protein BTV20_08825 [Histophilus somni]|uniref:Porin family protein n=1 Tax=Histophilus somni TaxID=731 RepID=A0A9Q6Z040_HISSO|nr:outer membrane beta-barrel protein [Histophilus somni]ARU65506.1 hypothetical protein BTV18_08375 [Histophilus somni]ARU67373.1 hypothetical protein BTV19_08805 [Histophilus somni]ARU69254.1 hypothetical protein BTV16_08820 [Histophilus somni]ARU71131.1 hypothetical protein BTV20_08825 [Histophilus somni]ARU73002.1 hypothetical protein BTV17_08800 [Histophilus somni]
MKKISIAATVLLSCMASGAMAQDTFTGFFMGGEVHHSKHGYKGTLYNAAKNEAQKKSGKIGFGLFGGYGFNFGDSNFVGQAEVKLRTGGSKITSNNELLSKEKFSFSVGYLQGYRISNNFMPYLKVSLNSHFYDLNANKICDSCTIKGNSVVGIGAAVGVKYAVTDKFDVGVEYQKVFLRNIEGDIRFKPQSLSLSASYYF